MNPDHDGDDAGTLRTFTVYVGYDHDGNVAYVGRTLRGARRLSDHARDKSWWQSIATIRLWHFASEESMAVAEARLIRELQPAYNIQRPSEEGIAKRLVTFNLRLTNDEKVAIEREAERRGLSRAGLVRALLIDEGLLAQSS